MSKEKVRSYKSLVQSSENMESFDKYLSTIKYNLRNIWKHLSEVVKSGNYLEAELVEYITSSDFLTILVEIIHKSDDFNVCQQVLDILFLIVHEYSLFPPNKKKLIVKHFTNPFHYFRLYRIMMIVELNFSSCMIADTKNDLQTKYLQILEAVFSKRPQHQFSSLMDNDATYCYQLLHENAKNKPKLKILITLTKLFCRTKKFCKVLGTKDFFIVLNEITVFSERIEVIVKIIRIMSKNSDVLKIMKTCPELCNLILTLLNDYIKKTIIKKYLIEILYQITKNNPRRMGNSDIWKNLLQIFTSCCVYSEKRLKLSAIKIYTLLNLGLPRKRIPAISSDVQLPEHVAQKLIREEISDSDSDQNEEDEDDYESRSSESENYDESDDEKESENSKMVLGEPPKIKQDCLWAAKYFENENFESHLWNEDIFFNLKLSITYTSNIKSLIFKYVEKPSRVKYIAFPDFVGAKSTGPVEALQPIINSFHIDYLHKRLHKPVKDFDSFRNLVNSSTNPRFMELSFKQDYDNISDVLLSSVERMKLHKAAKKGGVKEPLVFNSNFESGNLFAAEQIDLHEYNLYLSPDTSTVSCQKQWFYFEVSNMQADVDYVFNIVNLDKLNSQFNFGMQPVMFSTIAYILHNREWERAGKHIIYFGNNYTNNLQTKQYRSLSFQVRFEFDNDYCYFAYHFPYTYTRMLAHLYQLKTELSLKDIHLVTCNLTDTVQNNKVPLVTITSRKEKPLIEFKDRPYVFLTARVHPGESNSSWIMQGFLSFLLSDDNIAVQVRERYIFKIIPMINPEGCIYGNNRTGLTGCDLNRCWKNPDKDLHAEVYYAKAVAEYARKHEKHSIKAFIDIHGHSRKKSYFFYGCNPSLSWNSKDKDMPFSTGKQIPNHLIFDSAMKLSYCRYNIEKRKEKTCRVVMWREFFIENALTLECSYCATDNKTKITTNILENIGKNLIIAFSKLDAKKVNVH